MKLQNYFKKCFFRKLIYPLIYSSEDVECIIQNPVEKNSPRSQFFFANCRKTIILKRISWKSLLPSIFCSELNGWTSTTRVYLIPPRVVEILLETTKFKKKSFFSEKCLTSKSSSGLWTRKVQFSQTCWFFAKFLKMLNKSQDFPEKYFSHSCPWEQIKYNFDNQLFSQ